MAVIQKSTVKTEAHFSEDGKHRYLLRREWDKTKKKAVIIMKKPSQANCLMFDTTTMLVINNLTKLDYGSVDIANLYPQLEDLSVSEMSEESVACEANDDIIVSACAKADTIILAWGNACHSYKCTQLRINELLSKLDKHQDKLMVIQDKIGRGGFHPLAPTIRSAWKLVPYDNEKLKNA